MKKLSLPRMAAFDLDGTLVDSVPDLAWAGDEMLRQFGLPAQGEEQARRWVGNGIERFVKRMLTGEMNGEPDSDVFEKALPLYRDIYLKNGCRLTTVYPGVVEGLDYLQQKKIRLSCVTNKAGSFAERLLNHIGLSDYFELLVAGDTTTSRKPDPKPLWYAAENLGVSAADSLMVGDSKNDVEAARAAGFAVVCVPYGYNHGEDIRLSEPDIVIDNLAKLSECFV